MWYRVLKGLFCVFAGAIVGSLAVAYLAAHALGKGLIEMVKGLIR
jgi:hypothetical protein